MSRSTASTCLALSLLLATLGCTDNNGPAPAPVLRIEITSEGGDLDLDGYTLAIDGGTPQAVELNDVLVFEALEPGPHAIELGGVAGNCVTSGGDIRSVTLSQSDTALVAFSVGCTINGVRVAVTATGLDQDLVYDLFVDGLSQPISLAPVTVGRLTPGAHVFRLGGLDSNCRSEPEQHTVTVVASSTIPIAFGVRCVAATAVLRVTVTTEGEDQDLSGYTLGVSGRTVNVERNDVGYLNSVPAGVQSVALLGVARNCTTDEGNLTVEVPAGRLVRDTVDVALAIFCVRAWEVAFTRWGPAPQGLFVGRLDGSIAELAAEGHGVPAWSPDGNALAFSCVDVCILRLDGTPVTRLPTGYTTGGVSWSPDGTELVFGSYTCPEYCYYNEEFQGLAIVDAADGSDPRRIQLPDDVRWATDPEWSPDGRTIAFGCISSLGLGSGVCTVHIDGKGFRRLTEGAAPAWSPDGSRIAYTGREYTVWVMNADGTEAREIAGDAQSPAWTRDGQRVVFNGWRCNDIACGSTGLERVRPDGSERVRLTSHQDYNPAIRP